MKIFHDLDLNWICLLTVSCQASFIILNLEIIWIAVSFFFPLAVGNFLMHFLNT